MAKRKIKTPSSGGPVPLDTNSSISFEEWQRRRPPPPPLPPRPEPVFNYAPLFQNIGAVFKALFAGIAWCFNNIHQLMIAAFTLWIFMLLYIVAHVILKAQGYL